MVEDNDLIRIRSLHLYLTPTHGFEGCGRYEVEKHANSTLKIEVVIHLLSCFFGGQPIDKLERAETRFHCIGCHDLLPDFVVVTGRDRARSGRSGRSLNGWHGLIVAADSHEQRTCHTKTERDGTNECEFPLASPSLSWSLPVGIRCAV
jgi:hypothetical protein